VLVSRSETNVMVAPTISIRWRDALDRFAADYGATPAKGFDDMLVFVLSDDAAIARRVMHVGRKGKPPDASRSRRDMCRDNRGTK
jgi:hypothetical protein